MKIATAALYGTLAFSAALIAASGASAAQQAPCHRRDDVLGHPAQNHREVPVANGVTNRGGPVEVLSNGDGKTWTIIISSPDGQACMVAAGAGWRALSRADPRTVRKPEALRVWQGTGARASQTSIQHPAR